MMDNETAVIHFNSGGFLARQGSVDRITNDIAFAQMFYSRTAARLMAEALDLKEVTIDILRFVVHERIEL